MSASDWRNFWNSYRKGEGTSEKDLFVEVGKTVQGKPIARAQFEQIIARIGNLLRLSPNDKLLELCCGNGLMTRALAPRVAEIEAVDFSEHLIAHARERTKETNVRYFCAEVLERLNRLIEARNFVPTKILLGDALAYFEPGALRSMLELIAGLTTGEFLFLATNVPCDELKWNFYNTPDRKQRYAENQRQPSNTNDGLGRWWKKEELQRAGEELGIEATLFDQQVALSEYRIDVLFRSSN